MLFRSLTDSTVYHRGSAELLLKKRLESQVGKVEVRFLYPKELLRGSNGKIKAVISEISDLR